MSVVHISTAPSRGNSPRSASGCPEAVTHTLWTMPPSLPARPTLYCGQLMRSRLEAHVASGLDRSDLEWEYEPVAFAGPEGQYLPDFRLRTPIGNWYVEVKGPPVVEPRLLQQRMEVIWESEPDARLFLMDSAGQWWFGSEGQWTSG